MSNPSNPNMGLQSISASLNLPFFHLAGSWTPDTKELEAAWELYIELITRVATVPLQDGMLREALNSLYTLFKETRLILRKYGPNIARPKAGDLSAGYIAISVLNYGLRPFLTKWHIKLSEYEAAKPASESVTEYEKKWSENTPMRGELETLRVELLQYAKTLEEVLDIPSISHPS